MYYLENKLDYILTVNYKKNVQRSNFFYKLNILYKNKITKLGVNLINYQNFIYLIFMKNICER